MRSENQVLEMTEYQNATVATFDSKKNINLSYFRKVMKLKRLLKDNKYFLLIGILLCVICLDRNFSLVNSAAISFGSSSLLFAAIYLKSIIGMDFKLERDIEAENDMR